MKTFKLVGLRIIQKPTKRREEIPLIDGLIINKEDANKNWLIEAMVDKKYKTFFEDTSEHKGSLLIHATITKATNDPATFSAAVRSIKELEHHVSVLLDAQLIVNKTKLAEAVLSDLIDEGFEGEELLNAFKHKLELKRN